MSAVDHKASAEQLLLQSEKSTGDPTVWILVAQANAALYAAEQTAELVKQQRIANLIAVATWNDTALKSDDYLRKSTGQTAVLYAEERARVDAMFTAVREGLGLA